jgi:hypothetical protein
MRMRDDEDVVVCSFCGAPDPRLLGNCKSCGLRVCDRCGNYQHSMGQRFAMHDGCVRRDEGTFSMIKFVK